MQWKQLGWIGIGVIGMLVLSRLDYHAVLDKAPILYLIGLLAWLRCWRWGTRRFGAKRWLPVLGQFFQVSELAKLIIIVVLARFFTEVRTERLSLGDLCKAGVLTAFRWADSAAARLGHGDGAGSGGSRGCVPGWHTMEARGGAAAGGAMMLPVGWHFLKPYQKERVTTFLRPEEDPKGSGYQILQSKIAVGSGGFWGKGLGHGSQNQLGFVPVRYSDFILAALAEEMGFAGVFVALVLYPALLLRLIQNAQRAKDRAGMFLVMGVAAILGFHVLVNVAMVIGYMPVTGIPLPLMSYGGSATLFVFLALGLVMNVRLRRFVN